LKTSLSQEKLVSRLDLSQIEQLREIGDYLSQVRQQQAVPLEEVAARTFIPLRLLKALEAGQPDILPEPVFVQGFIRRYADLLGLDGIALARSFQTEPKPVAPEPIAEPQSQVMPDPTPMPDPAPVSTKAPISERPPAKPRDLSWVPYALISVVSIGVLGFAISQFLSSPRTAENQAQTQSATATSNRSALDSASSNQPAQPDAIASPSPQASPKPQSDAPIQVTITLTDESWVQITSDDKILLEGIFKKGYRKTWAAKEELVLEAGNAGGVRFSFNQGEEEAVGKPGDVGVIRFTPEKAEVQSVN
jgi:cytoskeleton protein RodZ